MLKTVSSNAILAKSRAMYGRRLTERNYTELLNCHSVNEVANYLKNRTAYADMFEGMAVTDIHRGQLETMLKKRVFDQYASLCRYEMSIGQDFYQYFIVRSDVDQILSCARLLSTGHPGDYLFAMPAFFNQHTKLDLFALAAVTSFDGLLAALQGTPYYDLMQLFARQKLTDINFLDMEAVLHRYLYERLEELLEKGFKGKARKEVMRAVGLQLDMEALVDIYRLKRMGHASPEQIRRFVVLGPASELRKRQIDMLIEAPSAAEMRRLLEATRYGRDFSGAFSYIEDAAQKLQYRRCLKDLRFSTNPSVVMLSFMFLAENEVNNITHIVEGIRYQVPSEEISRMLIGVGD
ncbi:MAG TPA: V-type ATPase subunit [Candidatus Fimivicinus intestinavium]|nr:V-type ATPase subunit [Candidatus Fimivicinus intestinavium]